MDHRKLPAMIEPGSLFGLLAILGLLWLTGQCLQNLPDGAGNMSSLIILGAFAGGAACPAVVRGLQRVGAFRLGGKTIGSPLQLQATTHPGQTTQPTTTLNPSQAERLPHMPVSGLVEAAATGEGVSMHGFYPSMTPAAFTAFCTKELLRTGWQPSVAVQPTDGEAGIVAERDQLRVAVRCEIDAQPIGYRAVMRATAARANQHAVFGVVVSNSSFTAAAQHLAAGNDILLLHYSDLPLLERMVARLARRAANRVDASDVVTPERG